MYDILNLFPFISGLQRNLKNLMKKRQAFQKTIRMKRKREYLINTMNNKMRYQDDTFHNKKTRLFPNLNHIAILNITY